MLVVWGAVPSMLGRATGLGITTSSADETKMFRPLPWYSVFSAAASRSSRNVGSRFCGFTFFPGLAVERFGARGAKLGAAACGLEDGADDSVNMGRNSYANATTA